MPELKSKAVLTYDQGYYRATCPACFKPVKWVAQAGSRDYLAAHQDCGLTFALVCKTYEVMVKDEHGNELGEDLTQPESAPVAQEPQAEIGNTELQPGGLVMVKVPGQPQ